MPPSGHFNAVVLLHFFKSDTPAIRETIRSLFDQSILSSVPAQRQKA